MSKSINGCPFTTCSLQNASAGLVLGLCRRSHIIWNRHYNHSTASSTFQDNRRGSRHFKCIITVLHRRCPQYLLELITFNDGESGTLVDVACNHPSCRHSALTDRIRPQSFFTNWNTDGVNKYKIIKHINKVERRQIHFTHSTLKSVRISRWSLPRRNRMMEQSDGKDLMI